MKYFSITIWLNRDLPTPHGYTPGTEDDVPTLRIGPLVIGWEFAE